MSPGIRLTVVDASQRFLDGLSDVTDPEKKRRIIGGLFVDVLQETAEKIQEAAASDKFGDIEWLLQGTLYPDVRQKFRVPPLPLKHRPISGTANSEVC